MSRVLRGTAHCAVFGLALAGAAMTSIPAAVAGDLAPPVYGPAPYEPPPYGVLPDRDGPCRIVLTRRLDPYGRLAVHRIRMCDEGPAYPVPGFAPPPPADYDDPPPRYFAPSHYDPYPRPPAPIVGY